MGCVRTRLYFTSLASGETAGEFPPTASRRSISLPEEVSRFQKNLCNKLSFPLQSLSFLLRCVEWRRIAKSVVFKGNYCASMLNRSLEKQLSIQFSLNPQEICVPTPFWKHFLNSECLKVFHVMEKFNQIHHKRLPPLLKLMSELSKGQSGHLNTLLSR